MELVVDIVRVAVAEPPAMKTLAGVTVSVRPGLLDTDNATVPVNALTAASPTVDDTVPPATIVKLVGLAVSVKSVTMKVTVTA